MHVSSYSIDESHLFNVIVMSSLVTTLIRLRDSVELDEARMHCLLQQQKTCTSDHIIFGESCHLRSHQSRHS